MCLPSAWRMCLPDQWLYLAWDGAGAPGGGLPKAGARRGERRTRRRRRRLIYIWLNSAVRRVVWRGVPW
jgi:hypothetical protein